MGRATAEEVRFYYVYILRCNNGKPYIGCTDNLKDRIDRHNKGNVPATKNRLPVKLIDYFAFSNKYTSFALFYLTHLIGVPARPAGGYSSTWQVLRSVS